MSYEDLVAFVEGGGFQCSPDCTEECSPDD
ncbi:hypothetical protein CDAR_17881, partial [Caerostris darwini]